MKFLSIQFPLELIAAIDEYRYAQRIPSRVEAIRRLLCKALGIKDKRQSERAA